MKPKISENMHYYGPPVQFVLAGSSRNESLNFMALPCILSLIALVVSSHRLLWPTRPFHRHQSVFKVDAPFWHQFRSCPNISQSPSAILTAFSHRSFSQMLMLELRSASFIMAHPCLSLNKPLISMAHPCILSLPAPSRN